MNFITSSANYVSIDMIKDVSKWNGAVALGRQGDKSAARQYLIDSVKELEQKDLLFGRGLGKGLLSSQLEALQSLHEVYDAITFHLRNNYLHVDKMQKPAAKANIGFWYWQVSATIGFIL